MDHFLFWPHFFTVSIGDKLLFNSNYKQSSWTSELQPGDPEGNSWGDKAKKGITSLFSQAFGILIDLCTCFWDIIHNPADWILLPFLINNILTYNVNPLFINAAVLNCSFAVKWRPISMQSCLLQTQAFSLQRAAATRCGHPSAFSNCWLWKLVNNFMAI